MGKAADRPGLAEEADLGFFPGHFRSVFVEADRLDGQGPADGWVEGLVDDPHPAFADL